MKLEQIKKEMMKFSDFYGGDLLCRGDISSASTKEDLAKIIESHRRHMKMMAIDADFHLDHFKKRIGLSINEIDKD